MFFCSGLLFFPLPVADLAVVEGAAVVVKALMVFNPVGSNDSWVCGRLLVEWEGWFGFWREMICWLLGVGFELFRREWGISCGFERDSDDWRRWVC
jgi:hypothetical protein